MDAQAWQERIVRAWDKVEAMSDEEREAWRVQYESLYDFFTEEDPDGAR